jgi:hypothetical protein
MSQTTVTQKEVYPFLFTYDDVMAGGNAENRALYFQKLDEREVVEVDEELFDYFLNVLPPVNMGERIGILGFHPNIRSDFGFAEGAENITYFFSRDGRHFAWQSGMMNPYA